MIDGETPGDDQAAAAVRVQGWADVGCTWFLETRWGELESTDERVGQMTDRLAAGPPRA